MSEEVVTLGELLDFSIGTPQGTVNFTALHALLNALLQHLGLRDLKTRWGGSASGHPVIELQERAAAAASDPGPSPGAAAAEDEKFKSRIRSCEDGVSEAMRLIQELHQQKEDLTEEVNQLHQQQTVLTETVSAVETRCQCVDESLRHLRDTVHEELSGCVTWDEMQSALLGDTDPVHQEGHTVDVPEPVHQEGHTVDVPDPVHQEGHTVDVPEPVHQELEPPPDAVGGEAPPSPGIPEGISQEESSARPIPEDSSAPSSPPRHETTSCTSRNSQRYSETVDALRNVVRLRDGFIGLDARVSTLQDEKVDQSQLAELRDAISNQGFQELCENLMDQLNQQTAAISSLKSDQDKSEELLKDMRTTMVQLQETTRSLQEDKLHIQSHMEKADKCLLDNEASRLQFDSVTEQLNTMFHELLDKVTGQERDWHEVVDKLSTEMEDKINRVELDSVKKQLEGRWKDIQDKLRPLGAPQDEDAAGIRKRLVDRFHCLSCDRPVVKHTPGPFLMTLPSTPAFPSHKSIRPFTAYALEQVRQHYRSDRLTAAVTDFRHVAASRGCGGGRTVTTGNQRRGALHTTKHQRGGGGGIQSEEVDIVGLDGQIYKGRLNGRNTEPKLPEISTQHGPRTKDRPTGYPSHRIRSAPCSRSASSHSTRDWRLSTLGCSSQNSIAQTTEPGDNGQGDP